MNSKSFSFKCWGVEKFHNFVDFIYEWPRGRKKLGHKTNLNLVMLLCHDSCVKEDERVNHDVLHNITLIQFYVRPEAF